MIIMNGFHECELKFFVDNHKTIEELTATLFTLCYEEQPERLETDYIFDKSAHTLKKEKILFRVRSLIVQDSEEILFTVKTKGTSSTFQDSLEFETSISAPNHEMIQEITTIIRERTGLVIPDMIFSSTSTKDIIHILSSVGLVPVNIVQKKRKEYSGSSVKVLIDSFPIIKGCFVEIEANSENALFESIQELGLDASQADKRNYGQIVAEMTNDVKILKF